MVRHFLWIGLAVFAFQCTGVFAGEEEPGAGDLVEAGRAPASLRNPAAVDEDEYNFSWLDPDKNVYVLQNRKYRKSGHLAAFLSGGVNLSNAYRTEYLAVPRLGYWFSEQFGLEVFYALVSNSENANIVAVKNRSNLIPFVRENRSYYGAAFSWTPWYAKLNFFNKILYFDWFFNAGIGQVNTALDQNAQANLASNFKTESLFALFYGTGMNFFVTREFSVRLDVIGMFYSATAADNVTKRTTTNYDFTVGVGYMF